jgi:hypothetical protein
MIRSSVLGSFIVDSGVRTSVVPNIAKRRIMVINGKLVEIQPKASLSLYFYLSIKITGNKEFKS